MYEKITVDYFEKHGKNTQYIQCVRAKGIQKYVLMI
jgi:hypothetical protein